MYRVVLCPNCGNYFMTEARKVVKCIYCRKSFTIKRLKRDGYILKETYDWDEAHEFLTYVTGRKAKVGK